MQRSTQARFYVEVVLPVMVSQVEANRAGEMAFFGGVSYVVSRFMATVTRTATDWRRVEDEERST